MRLSALHFRGIGVLGVAAALVATAFGISYQREKAARAERTQAHVRTEASRVARLMDANAGGLAQVIQSVADSLSAQQLSHRTLLRSLESLVERYPGLHSAGVGYAPQAYRSDQRLYAPFFVRQDETIRFTRVDTTYDYTAFDRAWYQRPIADGPTWLEPFYDESSGRFLVTYGAPFYAAQPDSGDAELRGVVCLNVSLDVVRDVVSEVDLGRTGYALLVTRTGSVLYHPVRKYVTEGLTMLEQLRRAGRTEEEVEPLAAILAEGGRGEFVHETNSATGRSAWVYYVGLPSTGWVLWATAFADEYLAQTPRMYHRLVWCGLAALLALCCFGLIAVGAHKGGTRRLVAAAVIVSVTILSSIACIWYLALTNPPVDPAEDVAVTSEDETHRFLRRTMSSVLENMTEDPIYIRTGVFVLSMSFPSANEVMLNGYVWQHYPKDLPEDMPRGFVIPDDVSPISRTTEAYRHTTEQGETIGWKFRAQLRLEFDYSRYPFDHHTVSLRLWHPDLQRQVILIPDFAAYDLINPTSLPGISEDLVLPGWSFRRSHFDYSVSHYNANFGLEQATHSLDWPELQYNFLIQRDFLNSMINVLSRPFVVAFLLFGLLLLARRREELKLLGFSAAGIIGTGGGFMLLVLAGDQMNLRKTIAAVGIAYAEFCFFALYALILLVVVSAVLYAYDVRSRFVQYGDNLLPKLLYWPLFLVLLLAATLWSFY